MRSIPSSSLEIHLSFMLYTSISTIHRLKLVTVTLFYRNCSDLRPSPVKGMLQTDACTFNVCASRLQMPVVSLHMPKIWR